MNNQNPFKWRHFESEIILLCVRWYLRYSLSYRDLEEMMQERGLHGLCCKNSRRNIMGVWPHLLVQLRRPLQTGWR